VPHPLAPAPRRRARCHRAGTAGRPTGGAGSHDPADLAGHPTWSAIRAPAVSRGHSPPPLPRSSAPPPRMTAIGKCAARPRIPT